MTDDDLEALRADNARQRRTIARVEALCEMLEANADDLRVNRRSANQQARLAALVRAALRGEP